jgi:trigger factor
MKSEVILSGSYERKVQFSVEAETVRQELDTAYHRLKGQVRLKGFRPGKAPRRVLEARFGSQVHADVASVLIQRGYTLALTEHELEPVSQPSVDQGDLNPSGDFEFAITFEVRPEVELDSYKGLEVVYPAIEVKDEELEAAIEQRLQGQARLVEVTDRDVESGDMVMVELVVKDGDEEVVNEPGTMVKTDGDFYYPGLGTWLVGAKPGKKKSGSVTFAENAQNEAVAGKKLKTSAKVLSIQSNQVPELTDELAEELGYEGGIKGMRTSLQAELEKSRDQMVRNQARANLLQSLIAANTFDVPRGMVEQQLKVLVEELRMQQAYRGIDPKSVHFNDAQIADLSMRSEFAVKGGLILDYVSKTESLEVSDDDIEAKYQEMADERGQSVEAIRGYFVKENSVEDLRNRLLEEKTLDWLLENSKLVDAPNEPVEETEVAKKAPAKKKASAKKAAAKKPAAKKEEAASTGVDLSVLKGTVGAVKKALETGDFDGSLADLLAAEEGGKARKGVISAITGRM